MKNVDKFAIVSGVLASAVANNGTFDLAYPSGFTQTSFQGGMLGTGSYLVVNGNDRYAVGAGGFSLSFGSTTVTVTNLTGASLAAGAAVTLSIDLVDGNEGAILAFPVELVSITGTQDVVTTFRPGFAGTLEEVDFLVNKPVTTAAKLATLSMTVNAVAVTGGAVALTSANATPMGKVITGTAITAGNAFGRDDTISVKATGVTAFAEGSGSLQVRVRRTRSDAY